MNPAIRADRVPIQLNVRVHEHQQLVSRQPGQHVTGWLLARPNGGSGGACATRSRSSSIPRRTAAILRGIEDDRLRVAQAPPLPPGWSGKQHACHVLAGLARHELLVFVDADVRLAPDAVSRMAGFMQAHAVGLASGFPRQVTVTWSEQLLLPLIHFMLLGFLPIAAMRRSVSPGLGAGCGQLFVSRREAYLRAGGHRAIRASLHDGIMLPRAFRRVGEMTGLFDAGGIASCRM